MNLSSFRLIAAPHTPMHDDGSLHGSIVKHQARHLIASGVGGAFIAGTTGEGQSLTVAERQLLTELWVNVEGRSKLEIFVHVGHNCQRDACHLAAHAVSVGADAIAMHAPSCFKPQSVEDLVDFCVPIAAAAPKAPFYLYDIPSMTGVALPTSQFLAKGRGRIPNLAGVKYSRLDIIELQECIQFADGFYDILWGCDEALLAGIALGTRGAVGSTYNFAAPLYLRIIEAVEADDWGTARSLQALSVQMVRFMQRYCAPAAIKSVMKMIGIDCGPVRPPLKELTNAQKVELQSDLTRIGFFKHIEIADDKVA
ncbi:MAG: dihydrodipicolinate synthase family protein [Pirellulales bacterium]|nr:dihydrodipicolinate synthase family protein [Pirellulales bacterium]